jgi:DNA-directed RNA polymerase subunit RPC12/RpoP
LSHPGAIELPGLRNLVKVMQMKSTVIRCHCGQRIVAKDVLQRSWYVRVFGPSFMYLKFRCSRCKRLGEKFVEQDKWDDTILRDIPSEMSLDEKKRFDKLGRISVDEEIDFHFALDDPEVLRGASPEGTDERE